MGVISGLNMAPILRLKQIKQYLPPDVPEILDELMKIMTPERSWKTFRDVLAKAEPPSIPYLGVFLTDLVFIDEGNPIYFFDYYRLRLINFPKCKMVYDVWEMIETCQSVPYKIEMTEPLYSYFEALSYSDENSLYAMSLIREPRT